MDLAVLRVSSDPYKPQKGREGKIRKDGGRGLAGLRLVHLLRLDCTERRLPALR